MALLAHQYPAGATPCVLELFHYSQRSEMKVSCTYLHRLSIKINPKVHHSYMCHYWLRSMSALVAYRPCLHESLMVMALGADQTSAL